MLLCLFELLLQLVDQVADVAVGLAQVLDGLAGVEHGGVVLVAALHADDGEGGFGNLFGKVHGELACLDDLALARGLLDGFDGEVEAVADHLLDVVDGDFAGAALHVFVNHLLGEVEGYLLAVQRALGDEGDKGALEFAHVGVDVVCDVLLKEIII